MTGSRKSSGIHLMWVSARPALGRNLLREDYHRDIPPIFSHPIILKAVSTVSRFAVDSENLGVTTKYRSAFNDRQGNYPEHGRFLPLSTLFRGRKSCHVRKYVRKVRRILLQCWPAGGWIAASWSANCSRKTGPCSLCMCVRISSGSEKRPSRFAVICRPSNHHGCAN